MRNCRVLLLLVALALSRDLAAQETAEWRGRVQEEVQLALDGYRDAMLSRDYESMIDFWSQSPDFVFAGDGRILGGIEAWLAETTRHYEETSDFQVWDWYNVNILPLSPTAASATVEIRMRWVDTEGETFNSRVAWTYVFQREADRWRVIHSNGTHVLL